MKKILSLFRSGALLILCGCSAFTSTSAIPAVAPFDLPRYLGVWHEAARLPHSFERGMNYVTAEYFRDPDGNLRVCNRGVKDGKPKEIFGYLRQKTPGTGELEVSFFRPFYGSYRIIALKPDYSAALVTSAAKNYAWILVRDPGDTAAVQEYLLLLKTRGFDCSKLEYPLMRQKQP